MTIDVIRLAREAGIEWQQHTGVIGRISVTTCGSKSVERLERFAALVATALQEEANRKANAGWALMCKKMVEAEREECAKVCDENAKRSERINNRLAHRFDAEAIRARKPA